MILRLAQEWLDEVPEKSQGKRDEMVNIFIIYVVILSDMAYSLTSERIYLELQRKHHRKELCVINQYVLPRKDVPPNKYVALRFLQNLHCQPNSQQLLASVKSMQKSILQLPNQISYSTEPDNLYVRQWLESGKAAFLSSQIVLNTRHSQHELQTTNLTTYLNLLTKRAIELKEVIFTSLQNSEILAWYVDRQFRRIVSWPCIELGVLARKLKKRIGIYSKEDKEIDAMVTEYKKIMRQKDDLDRDLFKMMLHTAKMRQLMKESQKKR